LAAALSRVVHAVVPIPAVAAASMQHLFVRWIINKHSESMVFRVVFVFQQTNKQTSGHHPILGLRGDPREI